MNTNRIASPGHVVPDCRRAFTLVELLVVLVILAVLASVRLPALARARNRTVQAQCAGNLRQFALAALIYGNENSGKFPSSSGPSGSWAWDMNPGIASNLTQHIPWQRMYCPDSGFKDDDNHRLYNFGICVLGYALTFPQTGSVFSSNRNWTITPQPITTGPTILPAPRASERVLLADATISQQSQSNEELRMNHSYVGIQGGYSKPHRTSHMAGLLPAGGNQAMLDGHVEWRKFADMHVRAAGVGVPVFWW